MPDDDTFEGMLVQRAKTMMAENNTDWVAIALQWDARTILQMAKTIQREYKIAALPCTQEAIDKSGAQLHTEEFRACIPRPSYTAGIIIAKAHHPLMEGYLNGWAASDDKRNKTRQREILEAVQHGVITAEQAGRILKLEDHSECM